MWGFENTTLSITIALPISFLVCCTLVHRYLDRSSDANWLYRAETCILSRVLHINLDSQHPRNQSQNQTQNAMEYCRRGHQNQTHHRTREGNSINYATEYSLGEYRSQQAAILKRIQQENDLQCMIITTRVCDKERKEVVLLDVEKGERQEGCNSGEESALDNHHQVPQPTVSDNHASDQCQICLEEYKVGDEIASSTNPECRHSFHASCITVWLVGSKNAECPVCRRNYLVSDQENNHDRSDGK